MSNDVNNIDPTSVPGAAPQLPPAGWYPDPHDSTAQRFWDGTQWTEHFAGPQAATAPAAGVAASAVGVASTNPGTGGAAVATAGRRGLPALKWWQWALVALGVLVLVGMIVNGINGSRGAGDAADDKPAKVSEKVQEEPAIEAEPVDDRAQVPGLVGSTVGEARAALEAAGFVIATPAGTGDDWVVATQTISEGRQTDAGTEVFVTAEAPKPVYSLAQQNAIRKAQSYLDFAGFSRTGLIGQLEYEGFSADEATFGADNAGADWNAEASQKAASYLEFTSFSREGLYDQLAYEGFTDTEIQFGLAAVGY